MARPLRRAWIEHPPARRRHRTWMFSMSMASLGWAVWWAELFLERYAPGRAPGLSSAAWVASAFAAVGFLAALFGLRARRAWLLLLAIPLVANGALLAAPWTLRTLRVVDAARDAPPPARSQG